MIGPNGQRITIPVSVAEENTEHPCQVVTWVFLPTLANSRETTLG
jgi:hypothetical protein